MKRLELVLILVAAAVAMAYTNLTTVGQTGNLFAAQIDNRFGITFLYDMGFSISGTPTASQVIPFACPQTVTFSTNFAGSQASCGTNPSETDIYTVKVNNSPIGSVSLSTSCVPTFTTLAVGTGVPINSWAVQGAASQTTLGIVTNTGAQMQAGDLLTANLTNYQPTGTNTTIAGAGWSCPVGNQFGSTNNGIVNSALCTKTAVAGDIGSTETFTNGGVSAQWAGGISAWRNAAIDVIGVGGTGASNPAAPSITTTATDTLYWFGWDYGAITVPAGYTTSFNLGVVANSQPIAASYKTGVAAGATGTVSGTATSNYMARLIGITPASGNVTCNAGQRLELDAPTTVSGANIAITLEGMR